MPNENHVQRLIGIEKAAAQKTGFRRGLVVGIFIPVLLFSTLIICLILSRNYVEKKIGEYVVSSVLTEVFTAFPDAYFTYNREKVISILDDFTNAASNHKISSSEFSGLGHQVLNALKDKTLTYEELDLILDKMQNALK